MKKCYADKDLDISTQPFVKPPDLEIELDCEKYIEQEDEKDESQKDPVF